MASPRKASPKKASPRKASPKKKSPKKKAAAKKPAAHPSFNEMVAAAIAALKERSGSSRQAIVKYIKANFKVNYGNLPHGCRYRQFIFLDISTLAEFVGIILLIMQIIGVRTQDKSKNIVWL